MGADRGIGRAVAVAFAREGADVLIAYQQPAEDEETVRMVPESGRAAITVAGHIQAEADCTALVDRGAKDPVHPVRRKERLRARSNLPVSPIPGSTREL